MLADLKKYAPAAGAALVGITAAEYVTKEKGTPTRIIGGFLGALAGLVIAAKLNLL